MKARRRMAAVATTALGMVLLAVPAASASEPLSNVECVSIKPSEENQDSTIIESKGSPQLGLLNLNQVLNDVVEKVNVLGIVQDAANDINVQDVQIIENFNLFSAASQAISCE